MGGEIEQATEVAETCISEKGALLAPTWDGGMDGERSSMFPRVDVDSVSSKKTPAP